MIISHKHKFIFVKTVKTAGTSMEIALSKYCGDADVITPIAPDDEEIRRQLGHRGPQGYFLPLRKYSLPDWRRLIKNRKRLAFNNHFSARRIRNLVDDKVWRTYFKFCFERNPWDKIISYYYWLHRDEPRPTLSEFIASGNAAALQGPNGFDLYTIEGEIAVDKVYLYEQMDSALAELRTIFNLPELPRLPRAKSTLRKDRRPYLAVLNDDDRIKIAKIFAKEISLFGYTFAAARGGAAA